MDTAVISAFVTLLTPLGAMAAAIFVLLNRRIKKSESARAELMAYVLTKCVDRSEDMAALADLIVRSGKEDDA